MPRRPSHPFERLLDTIRDSLLDATEDLVDDAIDTIERNYQRLNPPPPRPGSTGRSRSSPPRSRPRRGHKTSPGASQGQDGTLYEVLGVREDSPLEVIQGAYRALARKYHPDNKETGNVEWMKRINAANEVLSDPKKRRQYDRQIGII